MARIYHISGPGICYQAASVQPFPARWSCKGEGLITLLPAASSTL